MTSRSEQKRIKIQRRQMVIGDIHGGHKSLMQCLERSKFDYDKDELVCLGDVVDGWPETPQVVEELLKIKHLILIIGNHDVWARNWLENGLRHPVWEPQGGKATIDAYLKEPELMIKHRSLFKIARRYHEDYNVLPESKDKLFVHGGYDTTKPINEQTERYLTWDRDLWDNRHNKIDIRPYKEVFVGHTSIYNLHHYPVQYNNIWFMDTGGGMEGVLSIMDTNTKEFWQSDKVSSLYPNHKGR